MLEYASRLDIITQKNTAVEQYMSSGSNKILKKIQDISDETKWNNATEMTESIVTVLNFPNKIFFSDMAYFVVQVEPPSGTGNGTFKAVVSNQILSVATFVATKALLSPLVL